MEPLHAYQVNLLQNWRDLAAKGDSGEADKLLFELLRSISAIAGAIGFTG